MSGRRWPWLVIALVLAGTLTYGTVDDVGPRTDGQRLRGLYESVKCPQCQGQSVADSDAPAAKAIRAEIKRRIDAGEPDGEIRSYLVSRYGDDVLLTPSNDGLAGLVWFLPVAIFVCAVAGLAAAFRSWRRDRAPTVSADDRDLVAQALSTDD